MARLGSLARLVGRTRSTVAPGGSLDEFETMVRDALDTGALDRAVGRLLLRAVHFPRKSATDAMIPRTEVTAIPATATVSELLVLAARSGHSRLLVFGEDPDDVRGVATLRDAAMVPRGRRDQAVATITRKTLVVPETAPLPAVLSELRRDQVGMAVVVDEYGGTAGVITLHAVLEQVAGDVEKRESRVRPLRPPRRGWLVPASLHVEELAEEVGLLLPMDGYDTVGGYVMDQLGRLPRVEDEVEVGFGPSGEPSSYRGQRWRLRVHEMDGTRVVSVIVVGPDGRETRTS